MMGKKGDWYAGYNKLTLNFDDTEDLTIEEVIQGVRNSKEAAEKDGREIKKVKVAFIKRW